MVSEIKDNRCTSLTLKGERCKNKSFLKGECKIHASKRKHSSKSKKPSLGGVISATGTLAVLIEKLVKYWPDVLFYIETLLSGTADTSRMKNTPATNKELFIRLKHKLKYNYRPYKLDRFIQIKGSDYDLFSPFCPNNALIPGLLDEIHKELNKLKFYETLKILNRREAFKDAIKNGDLTEQDNNPNYYLRFTYMYSTNELHSFMHDKNKNYTTSKNNKKGFINKDELDKIVFSDKTNPEIYLTELFSQSRANEIEDAMKLTNLKSLNNR